MLIFIAITLAFVLVCLGAVFIPYWLNQPQTGNGVIVGEIVGSRTNYVYVKPVGDQGTKQLLHFQLSSDTSFASGSVGDDFSTMPELAPGTVVEIRYTYKKGDGWFTVTADSIKTADASATTEGWPELIADEDFDWHKSSAGRRITAEVLYTVKTEAPEGYIIYVKEYNEAYWGEFFIKADNKFITDELRELLDSGAAGYTVELHTLENTPFDYSTILGTFIINLIEE